MRRALSSLGALVALASACADPTSSARLPEAGALGPADSAHATVALSVTNVAVASGRSYAVVANGLAAGAAQYVDRTFSFVSPLPSSLAGQTYIKTANNDKSASTGSTSFLTFDVNQDVTVYVAHDDLVARPAWLKNGFTDTGLELVSTDNGKKHSLFSRTFPAGKVTLGANSDGYTDEGMYSVVIVPTGTTTAPAPEETVGPLALTNVRVASGRTYPVVANGVAPGALQYTDRKYTFTSPLPSSVAQLTYIKTANNDKRASAGSTSFLTFDVNQDVVVYVAHDDLVARPAWLKNGFTDTGLDMNSTDNGKKLSLFKRSFARGKVTIGANTDGYTNGSMYSVIVAPADGATEPAPAPSPDDATAPTVSITAPGSGATVSGTTTISATASDDVGVAGVRFEVDGAQIGSEDTTAPYSVSWNTTGVSDGSRTITVIARDAAGNVKPASRTVTVANGTTTVRSGYYVTPSGSSSGDGSASRPWSLSAALAHPSAVTPGDTIWVRAGTYTGNFTSRLTGTSSAPIVVRQYPGERATIAGTLGVEGGYTWFWGLEIANTNTGSADVMGVNANGPGTRLINLVIHDHSGNGIGLWRDAVNGEAYGNILYNNGFRGSSADSHGHGIYSQNLSGTKRLSDNIVFNTFGYGFHVYGSSSAGLQNYVIDGNVIFNSGKPGGSGEPNLLVGGGAPADNITVDGNMLYQQGTSGGTLWLGWSSSQSGTMTVRNNYVSGGAPALRMYNWSRATVSNNTLASNSGIFDILGSTSGYSWSGNTFFGSTDGGSRGTYGGSRPSGTKVFVRANRYERGRGHVVVYNWAGQGSVNADLSGVLQSGDRYEVRNAQNFYGAPVASGTYGGGSISLPMSAVSPSRPINGWERTAPSTGTEFHTFVVLRLEN